MAANIYPVCIYPHPEEQDLTQGQFLSGVLTGLNSVFTFLTGCNTKIKDPIWPYFLLIAGGRIVGSIPFFKGICAV